MFIKPGLTKINKHDSHKVMTLNFCTLFNSNYLSRGLVMYESLMRHCKDFHLYVYAFDDRCYSYFKSGTFKNLTVISLKEFENKELLRIKPGRTAAEYCWTCSASTIHHAITHYNLPNCTYIDADMLFYSDPGVLVDEMGNNSVLITAHRYSPAYDQSAVSGKFCVQFVTFKNTEKGMEVLNWWKDACIEWCYARVEDGKFGDQKYLEEFETRFGGVHELRHLGGGLAPWNIQQYRFRNEHGMIIGTEIASGKNFEAVFFHFHGLKFFDNSIVSYTGELYAVNKQVQDIFYKPYISLLNEARQRIRKWDTSFDPHGNSGPAPYKPLTLLWIVKAYLGGIRQSLRNVTARNLRKQVAHHYYFYNREK